MKPAAKTKMFYIVLGVMVAMVLRSALHIGIWEFVILGVVIILLAVVFKGGKGRDSGGKPER